MTFVTATTSADGSLVWAAALACVCGVREKRATIDCRTGQRAIRICAESAVRREGKLESAAAAVALRYDRAECGVGDDAGKTFFRFALSAFVVVSPIHRHTYENTDRGSATHVDVCDWSGASGTWWACAPGHLWNGT